jgi:hypothetical protein
MESRYSGKAALDELQRKLEAWQAKHQFEFGVLQTRAETLISKAKALIASGYQAAFPSMLQHAISDGEAALRYLESARGASTWLPQARSRTSDEQSEFVGVEESFKWYLTMARNSIGQGEVTLVRS